MCIHQKLTYTKTYRRKNCTWLSTVHEPRFQSEAIFIAKFKSCKYYLLQKRHNFKKNCSIHVHLHILETKSYLGDATVKCTKTLKFQVYINRLLLKKVIGYTICVVQDIWKTIVIDQFNHVFNWYFWHLLKNPQITIN